MLYTIDATINVASEDGWHLTRQVPTFFLDDAVQGIRSTKDAMRIALAILQSTPVEPHVRRTIHLTIRGGDTVLFRTIPPGG